MANQRTDVKGATVKVTLVKSPIGFKNNQATVAGLDALKDPTLIARLRGKELQDLERVRA